MFTPDSSGPCPPLPGLQIQNFRSSLGLRRNRRRVHKHALTLALLCLLSLGFHPRSHFRRAPPQNPCKFISLTSKAARPLFSSLPPDNPSSSTPAGPGNNNRDADRIVAAAHDAGIHKINFVLITHYHDDHVGGAPQLAASIPIGAFIDHGENRETADDITQNRWLAYQQLLSSGKYQHIAAKPGDILPVRGIQVKVISSDGALIEKALPGAGHPIRRAQTLPNLQRTRPKTLALLALSSLSAN